MITRNKRAISGRKAASVRDQATEIVQHFSARLRIEPDAPVYRGSFVHLDKTLTETKGHWVVTHVFVPDDDS
jgi:hypothetical protein